VLPAGALLVGIVAASGYGVSSYLTGTKMTGVLLVTVLVLLAASYFAAQWIEFRLLFPSGAVDSDGAEVGFWTYFDFTTRAMYWKASRGGDADGSPLGAWGYALRALELVGFVGGGALVPIVLRKLPYCTSCGVYQKTRELALLPAGVPRQSISKKKVEETQAYQQASTSAYAAAEAAMQAMLAAAAGRDGAALASEIAKAPKVSRLRAGKLTARIGVYLVHCPRCHDGRLKTAVFSGSGQQVRRIELAEQPMESAVVSAFLAARPRD
jgi:hypothetical protein